MWPFQVHLHISQQERTASDTAWNFLDQGKNTQPVTLHGPFLIKVIRCVTCTVDQLHFEIWLTYIIPNWSSSMSLRIAQDVRQRSATGIGMSTDQKQVQEFAQSVYKLQFIIHQPHPPSWQMLPLLPFSRLRFLHSSWNSCLSRRLSQPFVSADTGSSFSNLSRSLALTTLSQGVISKCRLASAWWYFLLGC